MFITESNLRSGTWQSFERAIARLLMHGGYEGVKIVGRTGDKGADLLASWKGKRWLVQAKHWKQKVGINVVDETIRAMRLYRADVPVIAALSGFDSEVYRVQKDHLSRNIPLQLWDASTLVKKAERLDDFAPSSKELRNYQEEAIKNIVRVYQEQQVKKAMIVMATGLGKTYVAAEAIRRINNINALKVMVIAHTNELVYQAERAFWPLLNKRQDTIVWNGYEQPSSRALKDTALVFACLNTLVNYLNYGNDLPEYDIILIDECHHVGAKMYETIINSTMAGKVNGPFLMGLTATPWRPDEIDLSDYFGEPLVSIDIVAGMKKGFLSNVDYRMHTDNIDWEALRKLNTGNKSITPKQINRTLFINEWDDAVVYELKKTWGEQHEPKAIVFCGTIDHAITMRDRINALGFCNAAAIYSQTSSGKTMTTYERNKVLCDFQDGFIHVVCAVDIFNEGVDVPDVNIIVFQRVTHSRRIFVQQLGRGLRLAPDKDKVIVLDFISDIRRFAAGLNLKDKLENGSCSQSSSPLRIKVYHKVEFKRVGGNDPETESFLRQWLDDVAAVENSGEDSSVLKFPPVLPEGRS